jgi:hypothetical protein
LELLIRRIFFAQDRLKKIFQLFLKITESVVEEKGSIGNVQPAGVNGWPVNQKKRA